MRTKKTAEFEFMGRYKLSADSYNIILQEKYHNKKQDTIVWQNIGYFSDPKTALDYIVMKEIREAWVDDLKEVVKAVEKLRQSIKAINGSPLPEVVRGV